MKKEDCPDREIGQTLRLKATRKSRPASHSAGSSGWLAQKTGAGPTFQWAGKVDAICRSRSNRAERPRAGCILRSFTYLSANPYQHPFLAWTSGRTPTKWSLSLPPGGRDCWLPHDSGAGLCWQHVGGVGSTTTTKAGL